MSRIFCAKLRIFCFLSIFFVLFSSFAFCENWTAELANCWDALEKDNSQRNQLERFKEIADSIEKGNPGIAEISDENELHQKWLALLADFENYWSENCPREFYVSHLSKFEKQHEESVEETVEIDGKKTKQTRTVYVPHWEYHAWIESGYTLKFQTILQIIKTGLLRARKSGWTDISSSWPIDCVSDVASVFYTSDRFSPVLSINGAQMYDLRFDVLDGSTVLLSGKRAISGGNAVFENVDKALSEKIDSAIENKRISYSLKEVLLLTGNSSGISAYSRYWIEYMNTKPQNLQSVRFWGAYNHLPRMRHAVDEAEARKIAEDNMVNIDGDGKLNSFSVLKTEVSQRFYKDVMQENPSQFKGSEKPAETLNWFDAIVFCNRLSEICKKKCVYSVRGETNPEDWNYRPHIREAILEDIKIDSTADGFRLPTEEEWIYFAKGGAVREESIFAGGDDINSLGWSKQNSKGKTQIIGEKGGNSLGLFDLTGNVWEWCFDVSDERGIFRIAHGGAWNYPPFHCRIEDRYIRYPQLAFNCLGFRIVSGVSGSNPKMPEDYENELSE